jgi:IPT/TIG domain
MQTGAKHVARTLAAASAMAVLLQCGGKVPLTAPNGAELSISANPTAIPVVDGVSTITIVGFKSADDGGGPLPDGTQIFLTSNVGLVEERVEMQNGVARGSLRSNGRAGLATVTARSGAGITAALDAPVLIGNATGINILLTANPPTVASPNFTTELVATVFDNDNNRMSDVPVIFTTSAGALASMGTSLRTNANGQALDRLTLLNEDSASVTVFSGAVSSNAVTVSKGTATAPIVTSVSPSSAAPGDTLAVTIRGANFQPGAIASFGQGIAVNSVTFASSGRLVANITIDANAQITTAGRTVTVTNPDGGSGSLADAFLVTTPGAAPAPFITSISPPSTATRGVPIVVTITGTNFQSGAVIGFTPGGIVINSTTVVSSTQIDVNITVPASVIVVPPNTQFDITVINPDGGQDTLPAGFTVT